MMLARAKSAYVLIEYDDVPSEEAIMLPPNTIAPPGHVWCGEWEVRHMARPHVGASVTLLWHNIYRKDSP